MRVAGAALGSLLLGGLATAGSVLAFRKGLLPLIELGFQPGAEWLVAFRRAGILLSALAGYWAYVHWHEKRKATELRLQPVQLMLAGVGGAGLLALPIAVLFAFGAYQVVLFRGASPSLLGVAAVIGIAATLEELMYRCLLFQVLERALGTRVALAAQAGLFALQHLENVKQGGASDVVAMLVSVVLLGLLWGAVFILTRNLWVAAVNHAAWNFTIVLSGLPLSGIEDWRKVAPLESRYAGPDWVTGGLFGPESSVLVIVSATVAVVLLLRTARRRGVFRAPAGSVRLTLTESRERRSTTIALEP
ncbi:MAG: CPBP family intramembrane glutamic endopeptidase [Gemmatimonadaceae bacterium]